MSAKNQILKLSQVMAVAAGTAVASNANAVEVWGWLWGQSTSAEANVGSPDWNCWLFAQVGDATPLVQLAADRVRWGSNGPEVLSGAEWRTWNPPGGVAIVVWNPVNKSFWMWTGWLWMQLDSISSDRD